MKTLYWLRKLFDEGPRVLRQAPKPPVQRARPWIEWLESRCVPTLSTLWSFSGNGPYQPYSNLLEDSSGNLFGTSYGSVGFGSIFAWVKATGTVTDLVDFDQVHGAYPDGALVEDSDGNLFGCTDVGGIGIVPYERFTGYGTVFELAKGSTSATPLAYFDNVVNGYDPEGGLVEDASGNLYGTTYHGGAFGDGTVFEVQKGGTAITTLASFNWSNGANPEGTLLVDSSGNLFGTTTNGGLYGWGSVFEVQNGSGTITTLASFNARDGSSPAGGLVEDADGNLFGTTSTGDALTANDGTVFEVLKGSGAITTLATFNGKNGQGSVASLVMDSSGNLFGTTLYGGPGFTKADTGYGTVFELRKGTGTITTVATFNGTDGAMPQGGLILDSSGNLFGTTKRGGIDDDGTIFEVQPYPSITSPALANWAANHVGYSQTMATTGGTGTVTFSATGTLPPGLIISSAGVLAGAPTTAGSYSFTVTATDSLGNNTSQSYSVLIYPSDTTLMVTAPPTATAGTPFSFTVIALDGAGNPLPTFSGIVSLSSSLGGVITPTSFPLTNGSGTVSLTLTTAGSNTLTGSCAGISALSSPVVVGPGALATYLLAVQGPSTVQAGTGVIVTVQAADQYDNPITSYSGPSTVTPSVSPTTGASNLPATVPIGKNGFGVFLANLQTVGTYGMYTISVASGSFSGSSSPVTVTPGPAAKLAYVAGINNVPITGPPNMPTGDIIHLMVAVEDLYGNIVTSDNSDSVTLRVASGPGTFTPDSVPTAPVQGGVAEFTLYTNEPHIALVQPGTYQLSAIVPGKYTGPNTAPFKILPLQVLAGSFKGAPWGFSFQFTAPYLTNSATPVLYGQGSGAGAPPPSVIVTTDPGNLSDTAAYVHGSLYYNPYQGTVNFVATNTTLEAMSGSPILPDGVYTVILHSSAATNGFQALFPGGGFLDGLGTGVVGSGDFTASFTVNAAAAGDDVVWTPATADGPGQALSAPGKNNTGGGYPIYLDDHTGAVTSIFASIDYDPTLLTVTPVSTPTYTVTVLPGAGVANLRYNGPALPAGSATLIGYLTATVPGGHTATVAYKSKNLLNIAGVILNSTPFLPNGAIPAVGDAALHLVGYVGDANGDGVYSSDDAMKITRVLLQADTGFAAYPLVDPVIVADTDGSGFIPADAALQANEAGVGVPTANLPIPPIPSGVVFLPIANNVDPTISIPCNVQVGANGTVSVPVDIDDAHPAGSTGLIEAHLVLTYDPQQFTVSAPDVHPGTLLAGRDWSVVPTIDQVTGQIGIALSSTAPITSSLAGSLVTIDFHPTGTITEPAPFELVASADPNGQYVATELEDAQGTFTLSPAPTNGFDPRIDGVVALPTAPAAVPISSSGVEAPTIVSAASDVQPTDSRYAKDTAMVESAGPNADVAPIEATAQEAAAVPTVAAVHVSAAPHVMAIAGSSALASISAGTLVSPLGAFVLQVGGPSLGFPANGGQRQGDQPFLLVKASFEPVVGAQFLPLSPPAEYLDLNGDEISSDLDWQGPRDPLSWGGQGESADHQALLPIAAPPAAVDQCFSQMDAADLSAEDE
jgi:uncharacterized repeat protein (TIGR03803 family)